MNMYLRKEKPLVVSKFCEIIYYKLSMAVISVEDYILPKWLDFVQKVKSLLAHCPFKDDGDFQ